MNTLGVIVILGGRNDDSGKLIKNAQERVDKAIEVFQKNPDYKLLPTGGFGVHFNTTHKPHAFYIKEYLLRHDIPESAIIPELVKSTNTIEDARLSKPIIERLGTKNIILVTSDFHVPRARLIFKKVFPEYSINVIGAKNSYPFKVKVRRYYHEWKQIIRIWLGLLKI